MCVLAFFDAGGVSPDSSLTIRLTKRRYRHLENNVTLDTLSAQSVPLCIQEEGYWLLDPSVMPKPAGGGPTPEPPTPGPGPTPTPEPGPEPTPETKIFKKVIVSGSVPIENYSQLFSSFVNTLKNNHLKIEVKFTASNNSTNPLAENSPIVKSVKESASQLGLEFEVEE